MSTRGCVAVGTLDEWKGVYNHFDSYPSGLGAEVWKWVKKLGAEELAKRIEGRGDWREIVTDGVCEYCGKKDVGQPHSINGPAFSAQYHIEFGKAPLSQYDAEAIRNLRSTGYSDPDAKWHQHHDPDETCRLTHDTPDAWIEWAYVIDIEAGQLHVLPHERVGENNDEPEYAYRHVCSVPLDEDEPNWDEIEAKAYPDEQDGQ